MKHKIRTTVIALAAVCAIAGVGSAQASAASWHVGTVELTKSMTLSTSTKTVASVLLSREGFNVECLGKTEIKHGSISPTNTGSIEHLVFTGCSSTEQCKPAATTIETEPLTLEASLGTGLEDHLRLRPTSGNVFLNLHLKGVGCPSSVPFYGASNSAMPKGQEESFENLEQEIVLGNTEEGGGISGAFKASLIQLYRWSFR